MNDTPPHSDGATLFAEFDANGVLRAASSAFLESAEDAAIAAYLAHFADFDGDASEEKRASVIADWRDRGAAIEARTADEHWRLLSSHASAAGGRCLLAIDITPAKARNALGRAMMRRHPFPIWANDIETGEVIFFNDRARELFEVGSEATKADGAPWRVADFFADPDENRIVVQELKTRGRVENYVLRAKTTTGREFWMSGAGTLIPHNGRLIALSAIQDVTTLKEHEHESRRSLDLVSDALRALTVGFALFDEEGRLVICNDRYKELNAAVAEFLTAGVYWETQLREIARRRAPRHALGREAVWVREILERSERYESFEIEHADGAQIAVSVRPTSLGGFIVTQDDVTQRKAAERLARDSEAMLSEILRASPANLCLSRIGDGEIIYQSPSCAALFGAEASAQDQFAERRDRADFLTELLPSGAVDNFHAVARNAAGARFPALFSARVIEFNGEEVMVSTVTDLTEQEAAREALRDANARLRDAIEALEEGFLLYDAEERLVMANQRYLEMNRPCAAQIVPGAFSRDITRALVDCGHLVDGERWLAEYDAEAAKGRTGAHRTFQFELANGASITSIRRPTREGGYVVTWLDVTERLRVQRELIAQREMLHQSEKLSALGELLAGVAHELNNPLSVVVGHALMLQEEVEGDGLRRRAEKIGGAAERCSRIVKTFLAMARQRPATLERTNLNTVVEAALDVAGYGLRSAGVAIERALASDLPPISADVDQLVQVFANLIVNAEHALRDRGADARLLIETATTAGGREIRARVRDNGVGIPESVRARIFEPFFTTKGVGDGTGVGLAFCHRIVEAHQGRIVVDVAPGGGAEFTLWFPVASDAEWSDDELAPSEGVGRGRALVVDDEEEVAELLAQFLAAAGFEVDVAGSAEAAIARLPGAYRLILSDVHMPGLGGQALLDVIRARWPALEARLGFVTGDTMSGGVGAFLHASGRPYLEKPATPADVRRLAFDLADAAAEETVP